MVSGPSQQLLTHRPRTSTVLSFPSYLFTSTEASTLFRCAIFLCNGGIWQESSKTVAVFPYTKPSSSNLEAEFGCSTSCLISSSTHSTFHQKPEFAHAQFEVQGKDSPGENMLCMTRRGQQRYSKNRRKHSWEKQKRQYPGI